MLYQADGKATALRIVVWDGLMFQISAKCVVINLKVQVVLLALITTPSFP